ncbi:MAG: TonB-dependent receptor [Bryobacterales bacterium]|nr:TonB-dependent receptor [Bryobacterales bacterium]
MKTSFIWGISVLSVAGIARAQTAAINGEIAGTVVDASDAAIAGATVSATNGATGYRQSTVTTLEGLYRLPVLPIGEYSVNVSANGFAGYERDGINLNAGSVATVNVELQLQSVTTQVLVSSGVPVVDPANTDVGSTLSANAQNLPLVSRNPFNFILEQPGISGHSNTEFGVPRLIDANGFLDRVNYQLDGSNNVESDRAGIRLLPISQTWIQEIQEVSNDFAPEFGNTVGTVSNSVTRSGTNYLYGEAAYLFRRTPMSARPALLPSNQPTPEVNVDAGFADAGGPLIKDRLFFFGGYEHVKRDLPTPVTVTPATVATLGLPANFANAIPFSQNVTFFIGKMDWQLSSKNRLTLRFNGHRNDSPYNSSVIGGLYLVDRTYDFLDRSYAGAAQLVSIISPNAINELRFQVPYRNESQDRFSATGSGPAISIPGVANFGNSLDVGFRFEEMTPEINENLSYNHRSHALKFGGSVRAIRDTEVQATAALYTFPNIAAFLAAVDGVNPRAYISFIQTLGNPSMRYNSLFSGVYAQDTWKPRPNITLTYGIRYDVYKPPTAIESSPFPYSRKFRTDKNNLAPRLGIAVGLGKFVVRASSGIFYDPFQTDMYRLALLNNGTPSFFAFATTPQLPFAPTFPNVLPGFHRARTSASRASTRSVRIFRCCIQ